MVYKLKRTYITRLGAEATMKNDRRNEYIEAETATVAISLYVGDRGCQLVGEVLELPGNAAVATCVENHVTHVIRATAIGADDAARAHLPDQLRH